MTKEEFLHKCISYGVDISKYDYSLVPNKLVNKEYIDIICKKHDKFTQLAQNHMRNFEGCKICKSLHQTKVRTKSQEQFIKEAKEIWGDKNDYSKAQYIDSNTEVTNIYCTIHNLYFNQIGNLHLRGHEGCKLCQKENRSKFQTKTKQEFIDDVTKTWNNINKKYGTSYKFDYSNINYEHSQDSLLRIKCLKHNVEFNQRAHGHLQAHLGCPLCKAEFQSSNSEKELLEFLKQSLPNNIQIQERVTNIIPPKELDIYIPEKYIAIEFNGLYWHSTEFKDRNYHLQKTIDCEKQNIQLIHIFEDEWLYKKDIVKSRLLSILGLSKYRKLHANSSRIIIKQVPIEEERRFLEANHLQGYYASQVCYGLYWKPKSKNQMYLVSLMSFGKLRLTNNSESKQGVYELYRYAVAKNFHIIEGASKLFNHFVEKFKPTEIVSYADRRWCINSEHTLYNRLGFRFESYSEPGFFWIENMKRYHRFKYRTDVRKRLGYRTEQEFMETENIQKIYDCGQLKYTLHK